MNSSNRNRLFFFNKKLQFKEFGKKISKITSGEGNVIKFNQKQTEMYIKSLNNEITIYRDLKKFEKVRQGFKYSEIPIKNIQDYYPFSYFNSITEENDSCLLAYSRNGTILWLKLNELNYEIFYENLIPLEDQETCKAGDFNEKENLLVISTAKGENNNLNRAIIFKLVSQSQKEINLANPIDGYNETKLKCYYTIDFLHVFEFNRFSFSSKMFSYLSALSLQMKIGEFPVILGHQWDGDNLLVNLVFDGEQIIELLKPGKYHNDVVMRLEPWSTKENGKVDEIWTIGWNGDIRKLKVKVRE